MLNAIDLRGLAEMACPERAFVSLYLSSPEEIRKIDDRAERIRSLLAERPAELENFEHSLNTIKETLESTPFEKDGLAVFSSYALDFFKGYPLDVSPPDVLRVGDCPFIRPLAELQEEYETFVVVAADNRAARIYLVSDGTPDEEDRVRGDVKNHVKVGGWSQKRYQRRRDNQLMHYAKEVGEVLGRLAEEVDFSRIVLLGSEETLHEIEEQLPTPLAEKVVAQEPIDLQNGEESILEEGFRLFFEQERQDEADLWERIRGEALAHDLGALGVEEAWSALLEGRVDTLAVLKDFVREGAHCRECDNILTSEGATVCPYCEADESSLFEVDVVEKLVEQAQLTHAHVDFVESADGLERAGGVAALLRY